MARTPQLQFSVGAMLLATTIVALVLGMVVLLEIPFSSPVVLGLLTAYLLFDGLWRVVVLKNLGDLRRRKRELAIKRAALAEEVQRLRNASGAEGNETVE